MGDRGARRWRLVRARRDAVPTSVRRFSARARRRRLDAARPWLVALALATLLGAVAGLVYVTPLLGVEHIRVEGVSIVSADAVRQAASVRHGTPLARVDLGDVGHRVRQLPPVAEATVTRSWPRGLVVRVVERTAVAAVAIPGGYGVLDREGVVYLTLPARPPELSQLRLETPGRTDPNTRAALTVLAALPDQLRGMLVTLVADAPTRIRLELRGGREIFWGDATENEAKARVATSLLARPGRVIDVSAPDVVTVR